MKAQKNDRRSLRTRQLLGDALTALILEKRYSDTTVQDILDRAQVSRSAFYAHYYDKDDLLVSEFERVLQALAAYEHRDAANDQQFLPSLALFRHIQERNDLYDALVGGRGLQVLFDAIQSALARNIQAQLQAMPQANAPRVPLPVVANAVAGTFLSLIKWWLDHKMPYSPEEMDEMFQRLVTPGVAEALANRD